MERGAQPELCFGLATRTYPRTRTIPSFSVLGLTGGGGRRAGGRSTGKVVSTLPGARCSEPLGRCSGQGAWSTSARSSVPGVRGGLAFRHRMIRQMHIFPSFEGGIVVQSALSPLCVEAGSGGEGGATPLAQHHCHHTLTVESEWCGAHLPHTARPKKTHYGTLPQDPATRRTHCV